MRRVPTGTAILLTTALIAGSCTGGDGGSRQTPPGPILPRGGTLRVGLLFFDPDFHYDPTTSAGPTTFGLARCCLLRTLMSYGAGPVETGGAESKPDLAARHPTVSGDGLTWTFELRRGLKYAPPLQDVEITAPDVVRAVRRMLSPSPPGLPEFFQPILGHYWANQYFTPVIEGARDFVDGKSSTISGLESPDPHTLIVHLTEPTGDLAYRFALPQTAPIPPDPSNPSAEFGVAEGHELDGYGRHLVASGPYMFEGSETIDFSKPPEQQATPSGFYPVVLVRNPSWRPASDPLRHAYVDRIEFDSPSLPEESLPEDDFLAMLDRYAERIETAEIDFLFDEIPTPAAFERFRNDPQLSDRAIATQGLSVSYLHMNLAQPPFDDIHVRRAVNAVIDKERLEEIWDKREPVEPFDHLAPDATEGGLLADYRPYPSADVPAAREEMKQSRYDSDGDGRCDGEACTLRTPWRDDPPWADLVRPIQEDLTTIGLELRATLTSSDDAFTACLDPASHTPLCVGGWAADFPSASTFFPPQFGSTALATGQNPMLLGLSPAEHRRAGYEARSVPNADDRLRACLQLVGSQGLTCWAEIDQYLMEAVVPSVPLVVGAAPAIFSQRVASFAWDAFSQTPALDQIALKPGSE